jgi:hypothetical protein
MCGSKKVQSVQVNNYYRHRLGLLLNHGGTDQLYPRVTIDLLPDEVLLEIFSFYMALSDEEDAWHTLVHVCQRWRYVVFGSPRRLDLRLFCRNLNGTLTKSLDIWPELPIAIRVYYGKACQPPSVTDVISVVKRNDRVCKISINNAPSSLLKEVAAISEPFPALIELELSTSSYAVDPPILPDSFLGGSVPHLRLFNLWGIPFPAMGKLLSSTRDLVTLYLGSIPPSGHIPPEAIVNILSGLTRLKKLHIGFYNRQFWGHGASQSSSVLSRVVLPALTTFDFSGNSKYLEEIVSRITAPLDCIDVALFDPPVVDIPLLRDFISRTKIFNAPNRADISFSNGNASVSLFRRKGDIDFKVLKLVIFYDYSHLSSCLRSCSSFFPPLPSLEHLGVYKSRYLPSGGQDEVENTQWMELLRPFITVRDLVLDEPAVLSVASALQELVREQVTKILPALQNIFLEGFESPDPVPEGIVKFIAAREHSGRSVIVHYLETKEERY